MNPIDRLRRKTSARRLPVGSGWLGHAAVGTQRLGGLVVVVADEGA